MKKIFFFAAALLASMTVLAADPTYESFDWASADAMAEGIAGDATVSIAVVTSGSDGNVNGHWYKPLNSAIDGSASNMGTHLTVSAASKIDSISVLFCPNGTSSTNLAWAGWGEGVTPSAEVGENFGTTASITASKSWEAAIWQTIDFSDKELFTVFISRQGKKLTNAGANISNFGDNQTVNLLGIRVWISDAVPSTDPVSSVTVAGEAEGFVGSSVKLTATTDVKADSIFWTVDGAVQENSNSKTFTLALEAAKTYAVVCHARNQYNAADEFAASEVFNVVATEKAVLSQVDVTEATVWDWTKAATVSEIKWEDTTTPKKNEEVLLANVIDMNNNADFNSQALLFSGEYPIRGGKYCQGAYLQFHTTVAGYVQVEFSNTGGGDRPNRYVAVNGVVNTEVGSNTADKVTSAFIPVEAGDVKIEGSFDPYEGQYLRFYKLVFGTGDIPTALENTEAAVKAEKVILEGQMFILKNGVLYNMQGAAVR